MLGAFGAALVLLLGASLIAEAHDFWLVPDAFQVADGSALAVRGQTSSRFPTSEAAVALDRIAAARILGAQGEERITQLSLSGTSLLLQHKPASAGQYTVAVALRPRSVRESAASFRRYLELEGAPQALATIEREGLLRGRDSVTRRYAKYAKTLVQVGRGGPRAFARVAGDPLEFVATTDPSAHRVGDTLLVRLLYRGQPLPGISVHAGVVAWPTDASARASDGGASEHLRLTSDPQGVVRLPLTHEGMWNVRTIHVVRAEPDAGADWDTHWATLVFLVEGDRGTRSGVAPAAGSVGQDSAAVAAVVERYHGALTSGDSAAALALLAPDALILESGGVETRAEYRSHHLPGDIQFARAVRSERGPLTVTVRGDVAWTVSTSTTQGEFRGRAINSAGAELMVLVRTPDGWKIGAIHWSSRSRRP